MNRPRQGLRGVKLTRCGPTEEAEEEERPPGGPADSYRPRGLRRHGTARADPLPVPAPLTAALGAVPRRQPVVVGLPRLLQRVLRELPRRRRRRHPRPPPGSHCSGGGRGGAGRGGRLRLSARRGRARTAREPGPGAGGGTLPRPERARRSQPTEARGSAGTRRRACSLLRGEVSRSPRRAAAGLRSIPSGGRRRAGSTARPFRRAVAAGGRAAGVGGQPVVCTEQRRVSFSAASTAQRRRTPRCLRRALTALKKACPGSVQCA